MEYVSRVLADVSSVNSGSHPTVRVEYASINKHFQMSMQTALTRDDMVRASKRFATLSRIRSLVFNLKPDFSDEQTRDLAA
jgi:hypothetical protein